MLNAVPCQWQYVPAVPLANVRGIRTGSAQDRERARGAALTIRRVTVPATRDIRDSRHCMGRSQRRLVEKIEIFLNQLTTSRYTIIIINNSVYKVVSL